MSSYVKLFASILDSTIWKTPPAITKVWVTMLAMADRDGIVEASLPGLADRAKVPLNVCQRAVEMFLAPDPHSKTPDREGRRIEVVPRGWRLLNFEAYRELQSLDDRRKKNAERQARFRDRHRVTPPVTQSNAPSRSVTPSDASCSLSSGSGSDLDPIRVSDPGGAARVPARSNDGANEIIRMSGHELCRLFGAVRSREVGGFEWQNVKVAGGVASTMAASIVDDPAAVADIVPTMELLFRKAKAGKAGTKSAEIVRDGSYAFAAWVSMWTSLREELHGAGPSAAAPSIYREIA